MKMSTQRCVKLGPRFISLTRLFLQMDTKKHRDRCVRSERTREARKAHLVAASCRHNDELLVLAERREALEHACTEGNTCGTPSTSNTVQQDPIPSTSSATPVLPHAPGEHSVMHHLPLLMDCTA
jgi:hypothetical protein